MTKSQIFNTAWALAKLAAVNFGGKSSSFFSESLKIVHAASGKAFAMPGNKSGSYRRVVVINAQQSDFSAFRTTDRDASVIEIMMVRDSELPVINDIISRLNNPVKPSSVKTSGGRRLELLSIAERNNLNHGKAWFCGEREIETMGMNPMYEGELICYVYSN